MVTYYLDMVTMLVINKNKNEITSKYEKVYNFKIPHEKIKHFHEVLTRLIKEVS